VRVRVRVRVMVRVGPLREPPSERACGLGEGEVEELVEQEIAAELEQIVRRSCGELVSERD